MRITARSSTWYAVGIVAALAAFGCGKEQSAAGGAPSASASAAASAPAPSASVAATPSASASAAPEVQHDCPAGSTGVGSFGKPCEAKGNARMMDVAWNGKADASGAPSFKVQNKSAKAILYGKMVVYFYDKAGKQIDAKEPIEGSEKTHSYHTCSGNIFAGAVNPNEKLTMNFSCMKKKDVPDGATGMEAEMQVVGFADASGKKNDFYWRNMDLTPEARPKGGVK